MAQLPTVGGDNNTWGTILNEYLGVSHNTNGTLKNIAGATVLADAFRTSVQTPFANPLICDATSHKDFICGDITGTTVINLTNTSDGDAGMIEVKMDGTAGHAVTLGGDFAGGKDIGGVEIDTAANADNFIGWRKVGPTVGGTIVYNIVQVHLPV